jgi:dynein heavy chain
MWQTYLDYADDYVVEGFFNTIVCSLNYFLDNTDVALQPEPLFLVKMELQVAASLFFDRVLEH